MWSNRDNNDFYENISLTLLNDYENRSGLSTYCDLDLIEHLLSSANSILEIGAGTGRILRNLLARQLPAKINALERSERLFNLLHHEFSHSLTLIKGDVLDYEPQSKFDLILWMWSGFSDFSPIEQSLLINKLALLLQPNGSIIIDTTRADVMPKNASAADGRFYQIKVEEVLINAYVPSEDEMKTYAQQAGLTNVKIFHYTTPTDRPRTLYQLHK